MRAVEAALKGAGSGEMIHGTGGELMVAQMKRAGVRYLFTNPGSFEVGFFDAFLDTPGINLILALHEGQRLSQGLGRTSIRQRARDCRDATPPRLISFWSAAVATLCLPGERRVVGCRTVSIQRFREKYEVSSPNFLDVLGRVAAEWAVVFSRGCLTYVGTKGPSRGELTASRR